MRDYLIVVGNVSAESFTTTSTIRCKTDITDYTNDFTKILCLSPKAFKFCGLSECSYGYVAEEFETVGLGHIISRDHADNLNHTVYQH